jgi:UDP-3-O-[3-hydroxymyristoyl] glucosamine N-acyltransferase
VQKAGDAMASEPGSQPRTRSIRVGDLALELGCELEGDADVSVDGVASLEEAGQRDLSFVRSRKFEKPLSTSRAGAIIAPQGIDAGGRPVIRSVHPGLDFARATRRLIPEVAPPPGISPAAWISGDASVDETASIGAGCALAAGVSIGPRSVLHPNVTLYEGVVVGADCVIHAGCVLRERTLLGDRVILQPGAVLGGDGFAYLPGKNGIEKVPQVGRVVVGDDAEIGVNSTVDRGALGDTRIGRGTKIDNLVQIAHNCVIGEEVIVIAQAGLSGSTVVEAGAVVMAQAGVVGHLTIGEGAVVGPQAGVHKDVAARTHVLGSPQREVSLQRRILSALPRLPDLLRRVRRLEKRLADSEGEVTDPR